VQRDFGQGKTTAGERHAQAQADQDLSHASSSSRLRRLPSNLLPAATSADLQLALGDGFTLPGRSGRGILPGDGGIMFYLAIDGGGSGCRAALSDVAGNDLARAEGGPANIASDFGAALTSLRGLALQVIGARPLSQVRAVLGVAGANLSGAGPRLAAELPFRAKVVQDATTSLRGALGTKDGIMAAIGTGSVFARQVGGEVKAIGGWGFRLGDEASGAWMGRLMLNRITRMIDGYCPFSPLAETLLAELGGGPGLVAFTLTKTPAEHARLVHRLAGAIDDPLSRHVLAETQAELRKAIGLLQTDPPLPVVWQGGLGPTLALPDWPRAEPLGTALDGAMAMARDEATWAA